MRERSDLTDRQANLNPFTGGEFVSATLSAGVNKTVRHGLGSVPDGIIVTKLSAPASLSIQSLARSTVTVVANANTEATFWVF